MKSVNSCGCCEGISVETPVQIENRPGLSAISYRVGTHRTFKESLIARLSLSNKEALRQLTTRKDHDFTIALLDAWAMVSDVLTFYQERIANESYLNTATELLSVLELARMVGYELRPGVAASTYLAFTIEAPLLLNSQAMIAGIASGSTEAPMVKIAKGIKVQSVPAQDEKPQTFETIEAIEGKFEWNAMKPRMTKPQENTVIANCIYLEGTSYNLSKGNIILIKKDSNEKLRKIRRIDIDNDRTIVCFSSDSLSVEQVNSNTIRNQTPIFRSQTNRTTLEQTMTSGYLEGTYNQAELYAYLTNQGWKTTELEKNINTQRSNKKQKELQESVDEGVYVFRRSASIFGYNAPLKITYNRKGIPSQGEWAFEESSNQNKLYLDNVYEEILGNSIIAIQKSAETLNQAETYSVTDVNTRTKSEYGISAKTTELSIGEQNWWESDTDLSTIRSIIVHIQSEPLILSEEPLSKIINKEIGITLGQFYPNLKAGKTIIITGERADLVGVYNSEVKIVEKVLLVDGYTRLVFDKPLQHPYFRESVVINANVALATHGETVNEVLGNGNARFTFQKFVLKHTPLTYTSANSPSGTVSSLDVRVNGILWKEVNSLYGKKPKERIYITRQNDRGQTTVIFGDSITGSRLPTGQQNITATYRKGIGSEGILKSHQLSQLMSRPLGVKGVVNPLSSVGAQDRERLRDAKANASLTMYTLDRIVSLQDYEDFARAFAGISKAYIIQTWNGSSQGIHITIAGANGGLIARGSTVYNNLLAAIYKASESKTIVVVESYVKSLFRIEAKLKINPNYILNKVIQLTREKLLELYSFEHRDLGQSVFLSEVSSIILSIEGVEAVDLDYLYVEGRERKRNERLVPNLVISGTESPLAAELLILNLLPNDLTIMS